MKHLVGTLAEDANRLALHVLAVGIPGPISSIRRRSTTWRVSGCRDGHGPAEMMGDAQPHATDSPLAGNGLPSRVGAAIGRHVAAPMGPGRATPVSFCVPLPDKSS
ncbi:MAG: hypothetical protein M3179_08305 [Actinomycetota bacterium]|nr:hypothetical protein [Actinomycetota bacterium]